MTLSQVVEIINRHYMTPELLEAMAECDAPRRLAEAYGTPEEVAYHQRTSRELFEAAARRRIYFQERGWRDAAS